MGGKKCPPAKLFPTWTNEFLQLNWQKASYFFRAFICTEVKGSSCRCLSLSREYVLILVVLIKPDELFYLMIQVPAYFSLDFCKACSGALGHRWEEGQKHLQNKPLCYLLILLGQSRGYKLIWESVPVEVRDYAGQEGSGWNSERKSLGKSWGIFKLKGLLDCTSEEIRNKKEQEQRLEKAAGGAQICSPYVPLRGPQGLGTHVADVTAGGVETPWWEWEGAEGRTMLWFSLSLLQWCLMLQCKM